MSLRIGLDTAVSGLSTTAEQTGIVSRNIARAGDPSATRKSANIVTTLGGGVHVASITRTTNQALLDKMLAATTGAASQKAIADALGNLDETVNDPDLENSPAAQISKFAAALQQYAQAPQDAVLARTAVIAAKDLASTLNAATTTVQGVRASADADMAGAVARVNDLLAQFETVNNRIKLGSTSGADITDDLDARDHLVSQIAEEIGVRTVTRANNDMALYTDTGVTLFDTRARAVTFSAIPLYTAATTGSAVYVDGVVVAGGTGMMGTTSGRIAALAKVRDDIAVTYQGQLDEMARGLIEAFAESDQSATPTLPNAPGLFTWSGAPTMPTTGTINVGLAAGIRVNTAIDPDQGGSPTVLRDGGAAGAAYVYNSSGGTGFADRLHQLFDRLDQPRSFDPAAGAGANLNLSAYASSSVSWLQAARKSASDDADYKNTLLDRTSDALSKATGINLDEEMTLLLELERSYQASSKIISTIDNMFGVLLAAAGR